MKTARLPRALGFVLYRGPSLIDGAPIAVIATMKSRNTKTGNMVQTWIIRTDVAPMAALQSGADVSICGDCPHRPMLGGACYVDVSRAPSQVYKAFARGRYVDISARPELIAMVGRGRMVRLGAYGDPMAAPASVWQALVAEAAGRTGYTHQWQNARGLAAEHVAAMLQLCMASADTPAEHATAKAAGYRTFRIRLADEPLARREIACPASDEGGNRTTCEACGACDGAERARAADVAIVVHGSKSGRYAAMRAAA